MTQDPSQTPADRDDAAPRITPATFSTAAGAAPPSSAPAPLADDVTPPAEDTVPRRTRRRVDPDGEALASQQVPPATKSPATKPPVDAILPPGQPQGAEPTATAPTSTLATVPLEDSFVDDAAARARARDRAVVGSGRVSVALQVVLAILAPFVLLIGVLRFIASPVFLWLEYHRPGFPADAYGMDTEQRLTLGSYGVDYLLNLAPASYLADLRFANGNPVFTEAEVGHMADVKQVMMLFMLAGLLAAIVCVVIMVLLYRMRKGAIARSLFAGAIWLTVALIAVAVVAALGWEAFFAWFHSVFFADGTWTFYTTDSLIRLYPAQFWIDAGIVLAALTLIGLLIILVTTAPTGRRRFRNAQAQRFLEAQVTGSHGTPTPQAKR